MPLELLSITKDKLQTSYDTFEADNQERIHELGFFAFAGVQDSMKYKPLMFVELCEGFGLP